MDKVNIEAFLNCLTINQLDYIGLYCQDRIKDLVGPVEIKKPITKEEVIKMFAECFDSPRNQSTLIKENYITNFQKHQFEVRHERGMLRLTKDPKPTIQFYASNDKKYNYVGADGKKMDSMKWPQVVEIIELEYFKMEDLYFHDESPWRKLKAKAR